MSAPLDHLELLRGTLAATGYGYQYDAPNGSCGLVNPRSKHRPRVICNLPATHSVQFRNGCRVTACEIHSQEFAAQSKSFLLAIEPLNPGDHTMPSLHVADRFPDNPMIRLVRQSRASGQPLSVTVPGVHADELTAALLDAERKLSGESIRVRIIYRYSDVEGPLETDDLTDIPADDATVSVSFQGY